MAEFHWRIATSGYKWGTDQDVIDEFGTGPHYYLEPVIYEFRDYQPLDCPQLFQEFAHLDPTPDAMLEFANEYGSLGTFFSKLNEPFEPDEDIKTPQQRREWEHELYRERTIWDPLEHWELAIRKMHSCVQQWNRIRSGSVATKDRQDFLIRINEEIVDHTVEVQIELCTRSPSGFRMSYVPRNLMGAMWVQFAQAIAENDDFRKCQACDRWFQIALGENRKSRLHCSDACKSKSYRLRRNDARKMWEAGKTITEIADALGSDHSTVQKWVATDND